MTPLSEKLRQISPSRDFLDWEALRSQSLAPGGFGSTRAYIWPKLLHVHINTLEIPEGQDEPEPHRDERQIRLDTDRSFVLYPVDDGPGDDRFARQAELNTLIVQLFRRHPGLNYFQGFHDIATVLHLHRLRDSMGHTLEPLTAIMLILQRLLRLADPTYAALLEEHAPLPYAALPHLLTLLAHATPTLPLIQHIFDYILVRPPLAIVYLVAAITLSRKDLVLKLSDGGDEGMIHSVLTGLPEFVDYGQDGLLGNANLELAKATTEHSDCTQQDSHSPPTYPIADPEKAQADWDLCAPMNGPVSASFSDGTGATSVTLVGTAGDSVHSIPHEDKPSIPVICDPSIPPASPQVIPTRSTSPTRPASPVFPHPTLSLSSVLVLADELSTRFPPDTPELRLTQTLGPSSAMRTWEEDVIRMPSDELAETIVVAGVDIVVPEAPEPLKKLDLFKKRKQKARKEAGLLVAGAVVVLGVAVVYGVHARGGGGLDMIGTGTEWRALVGALGALGDRVLGALGDGYIEL
ncbi:hypothetical protein EI94DRAFT_1725205 [Lactarius quietus]|nr:hypothetical protein EI94DRAFT_1725205 [Lactarius quietus]